MARAGIYANGKEIVARYIGDKLVWKKGRVAFTITIGTWNEKWSVNVPTLEGTISYFSSVQNGRYSNIQIRMRGKTYTIDTLEIYDSPRYSYTKEFTMEFSNRGSLNEFNSLYSSDYKIEILI